MNETNTNQNGLFRGYDELLDIGVEFISDLGMTTISVRELLKLDVGSVIDLDKPAGESVELYINNRIFICCIFYEYMSKISILSRIFQIKIYTKSQKFV